MSSEPTHEIKVLIVEDEHDSAEIIDSLLRHYQLSADHVANAEDAYESLMTLNYDAVIVDLFLPGIAGLDLIRQIRQQPELAALPCIAITAYNSSGLRKEAYDAGCNRYYSKPLDPNELARGLRDIIS
jgi:CheY-like chemotaxis protein